MNINIIALKRMSIVAIFLSGWLSFYVNAATYSMTTGVYNATLHVAQKALDESTCSGLSRDRLAALMLSIPFWEVARGASRLSVSPMTLSRWDGWSSTKNRNLYSHAEYGNYKRAHWNPGVGLWQLDTWASTLHLNHGDRMRVDYGGLYVARYLRDGYCKGTSEIKRRLNGNWFACRTDRCWNTYLDMYNGGNLSVKKTSGSQWDGGLKNYRCRWGASNNTFKCYWINPQLHEGYMDVSDPYGNGSRTPLATGFYAMTTASQKRAIWLMGSGLGKEIRKSVSTSSGARSVNGWVDGTSLEVRIGGRWSKYGHDIVSENVAIYN